MIRASHVNILAILAGLMDTTTGALLVASPALTFRLMMVPDVVAEPFFVRFVGAFVGAVGLVYLYPFTASSPERRARILEGSLRTTMVVRSVIAIFVGASILTGALTIHWATVFVSDAGLAIIQAAILRNGVLER